MTGPVGTRNLTQEIAKRAKKNTKKDETAMRNHLAIFRRIMGMPNEGS
jgi:hypothetical protein